MTATQSPSRRALRDALLATVVVLFGGLFFTTWDTAERVSKALLHWEWLQLDDLLLTSCLAVATSGAFALRRWHDAASQLQALRRSEREKQRYLQRLEALSAQLLAAEEDERARLAEALHDTVGQTLYACRLRLEQLEARIQQPDAQRLLQQAHALASSAMEHARDLTVDLSPPILHDLGLSEAIAWLLQRFEDEHAGVQVRLAATEGLEHVPKRCHAPLFHSIKELLFNAGKHAGATLIAVTSAIARDGSISICVQDDGRGFDREQASGTSFGLFSIERRMACMGAELQIESAAGSGTCATLRLNPSLASG